MAYKFALLVEDIDLIIPILNEHMKELDKENGCGFSLGTEYWGLMLKLHRIKAYLSSSNPKDEK